MKKALTIAFAASLLALGTEPAKAFPYNINADDILSSGWIGSAEENTTNLADLKAQGSSCNFFDTPFSQVQHVADTKMVMQKLWTTWDTSYPHKLRKDGWKGSYDDAKHTTDCKKSSVWLTCNSGDCWLSPDSGKYGYHPGETSRVVIDGRHFSWVGDMPTAVGRQMWKTVKDGSVIKASIAQWPGRITNTREVVNGVQELKNEVYTLSVN